jgi:hypothetical protein
MLVPVLISEKVSQFDQRLKHPEAALGGSVPVIEQNV